MSKIIYICFRHKKPAEDDLNRLRGVCDSLNPDNIKAAESHVRREGQILFGISNPGPTLEIKGQNVLLGKIFGEKDKWESLSSDPLDGNYAIFRKDSSALEIVSDILATRTVWYYHNEEVFIASSSQLAIVDYLGDFRFNQEVIPWIFANGMLGPGLSWDKRFSQIEPDTRLQLDFSSWNVKLKINPVQFRTNERDDKENVEFLRNTLESTFSSLDLDYNKWNLTLSGGYDSRANLLFLQKKDRNGVRLNSVTWGIRESENKKGNDAAVAAELANKFKLDHNYFPTDSKEEPIEVLVERFLKNGEGRIDHLGGYMDGFRVWQILFQNKRTGVIRGDEVFGSYYFISEFHLKNFMGLSLCKEYENLKKYSYIQCLPQKYPLRFRQIDEESFEQWRDRLYQTYLVPVFLGALADLKQGYVEQINPLLARKVILAVRELPDHLRTQKKAFKQIVDSFDVGIGYAREGATKSIKNIFKQQDMIDLVSAKLRDEKAMVIFPREFLEKLIIQINKKQQEPGRKTKLVNLLKNLVPKKWKKMILKQNFTPKLDEHVLAFRVFLILRMIEIFQERGKTS